MRNLARSLFAVTAVASLVGFADSAYAQPTGTFDIYKVDLRTGDISQISAISGADEFNPSVSNSGKTVVHDVVVVAPFSHNLYVTDVKSGTSAPVAGGDGGNDPVYSPNGQFIAFDRTPIGDPSLYTLPAAGGERTLLRQFAVGPSWSRDGLRIAFTAVIDLSIRTMSVVDGSETEVASFGFDAVWSPNGRYIAFTDGNSLFVVEVDHFGEPEGAPVQITFDGPTVFNTAPSWSVSSKQLVFHSNRDGDDFDIWTVPVTGGAPTRVAGLSESDDFDPAYSNNGRFLVYAGFTQ